MDLDVHTIIGAVSASVRKRSSLSRSAASARLRSVMSTMTPRSVAGAAVDEVDRHPVLQPDHPPVGGDHAVVELVIAAGFRVHSTQKRTDASRSPGWMCAVQKLGSSSQALTG